jgi:hypothetical protein
MQPVPLRNSDAKKQHESKALHKTVAGTCEGPLSFLPGIGSPITFWVALSSWRPFVTCASRHEDRRCFLTTSQSMPSQNLFPQSLGGQGVADYNGFFDVAFFLLRVTYLKGHNNAVVRKVIRWASTHHKSFGC